jgi:dimethylaniline monooxygenase (N-oxide forming)
VDGKPVDHIRTYRKGVFLEQLSRYAPAIWTKVMNGVILGLRNKLYKLKPEWRFDPAPSVNQARPIISDTLIRHLSEGGITSVMPIREVVDEKTVELTDGTCVEVDSIIWCTGYTVDYSILGKSAPTANRGAGIKSGNGRPIPRLYQNILSLEHPESLAFMGNLSFMNPAFLMFDLATMALAQIWKGRSKLPSKEEMNRAVDEQHQWIASLATNGQVTPGLVKAADWLNWVEDAAGLGVKENLGYGVQGWTLWLTDRKFCNMLMDGLLLPFQYRLFEGKRKTWDGARDAIIKVNRELAERDW